MKKTIICFICCCCLLSPLTARNYQQEIDLALHAITQSKSMETLNRLVQELETSAKDQDLLVYWKAYAKYKQALAYQALHEKEKDCRKQCAKMLSEGIRALEEKKHKYSEDYALLSIMRNLSIRYNATLKIPIISQAAKSDAQAAIKADSENLRAYVAAGVQDYFTPALYGGGSAYEQYFLQALALPDQTQENPYQPSWGREDAYFYLIIHYYNQGLCNKAKDLLVEALAIYPQESRLLDLADQMKKHGRL